MDAQPRTPLLTTLCVAMAVVAWAQQLPTPLEFSALEEDYPGLVYDDPPVPPADLVLYRGEELLLTMQVANLGGQLHQLSKPGDTSTRFRARWTGQGATGRTVPPIAVRERPNAEALPPRTMLRWKTAIQPEPSDAVGQYELTIEPTFATASARVQGIGTIVRYELRDVVSLGERVEDLRRRSGRAYQSGRATTALSLLDELLAIYPTAYNAYYRKGEILEESGRRQEALLAYVSARQLLVENRDRLLKASEEQQHSVILRLSQKIEELQYY